MEQLKSMKDQLIAQVQAQLGNIHQADCRELGAAVDMIKDIAETEYYCSIVKAMEEKEEENNSTERYFYTERYMHIPYQRALEKERERDMDRGYGRMYYETPRVAENTERVYEMPIRDAREGRSPSRRKQYMESKETHQPKEQQLHDLESYMQELSQDITEMIRGATPEEHQMLQAKLQTLSNKI